MPTFDLQTEIKSSAFLKMGDGIQSALSYSSQEIKELCRRFCDDAASNGMHLVFIPIA